MITTENGKPHMMYCIAIHKGNQTYVKVREGRSAPGLG